MHIVFGMTLFFPWYFVDSVKETMTMLYYRVSALWFMNASTCIYMYCNIESNIMKIQFRSPGFGIEGKISMYICFMFYVLTIVYSFVLRIRFAR